MKKMKYKGINKIYFGIGFKPNHATLGDTEFYFYWFKLIQRNPECEMLKHGRDYKGFLLIKRFRIPTFGINI